MNESEEWNGRTSENFGGIVRLRWKSIVVPLGFRPNSPNFKDITSLIYRRIVVRPFRTSPPYFEIPSNLNFPHCFPSQTSSNFHGGRRLTRGGSDLLKTLKEKCLEKKLQDKCLSRNLKTNIICNIISKIYVVH